MTEVNSVPLVQATGVLSSIVESKKVTPTDNADTTTTQSLLGNETLSTSFSETSSANSELATFWGSYTGGLSGMAASTSGSVGQGFTSSTTDSINIPGSNAISSALDIAVSKMDNVIEVAGSGMGGDKKYKMFTSELIAVYAALKQKDNQKPEELQATLKEKYGIDAEVKDIDGKKTLVNKATGNILIADGNGNNLMDKSDLKFKEALNKAGLDEDLKWLPGGEYYQIPNYEYKVNQTLGDKTSTSRGTTVEGVDDSGISDETKAAIEKLLLEKNGGKTSAELTQQALLKTQSGATVEEAVSSVITASGASTNKPTNVSSLASNLFAGAYNYAK